MLKTFVTLFRGIANRSAQEAIDRHATIILDQQMRDAAAAVSASRRALAVAIAQDRSEARRAGTLRARLADLETRAVAALSGGREDLAQEGAEAIAALEADAGAAEEACRRFAAEAARLKRQVGDAERRLARLERGRRIAEAAEAVRRLRSSAGTAATASPLAEAEATLERLERQQAEDETADEALRGLDAALTSESLAERLAEEGFGPPLRVSAADVLERLRRKAGQPAAADA
jgi:phage shock protein A